MGNILLPLQAGTWPEGVCPSSWAQALSIIAANMSAVLNGQTFFNYGSSKPDPSLQGYPWLRTTDMRWYEYVGVWRSPVAYDTNERRLYVGTLTDLLTYDGGDAGAISATTGAMWTEDTDFQGRSPMGPGNIPSTTGPVAIAVAANAGAGEHTLTIAELQHMHGVGTDPNLFNPPATDDPATQLHRAWDTAPTSYTSSGNDMEPTSASGYKDGGPISSGIFGTTKAVTDPDVNPSAHSVLHPVRGIYIVKRTARHYYTAP